MSTKSMGVAPDASRQRLLAGIPVEQRRARFAGIVTTLLHGGSGPPVVLLHGTGETAVNWRWVLPELVAAHRVVAPDLPAHGASGGADERLDEDRVLAWLDELLERTCDAPPILVGHVLGGALAVRYAVRAGARLRHVVLVDSLGLAPFRPSLRFLLTMIGFQIHPSERTYRRFMHHCAYDLDGLRSRMGGQWEAFVDHNLSQARSPGAKAAGRMFRELGLPRVPPAELERITVPTSLIWGRDDRALKLPIAEAANRRYGWPLHVIDEAADDPARDRPEAFLEAFRRTVGRESAQGMAQLQ